MLQYWLQRAPQPIRSVADDSKTFTLNVLAAALFTKPYPFEGQEEMKKRQTSVEDPSDDAHQYRDSFSKILRGIILIAIFGGEKLRISSWMPKSWNQVGQAVQDFRLYVLRMIEEERESIDKNVSTRKDLVSALVRASLAQKNDGRDMTITEQDIISNTFVYGFAGNDTTAISLAHTIVNLAAYPATQEWIREEIRYYCEDDDFTKWPYATWTKLKRCQAVVVSIDTHDKLPLLTELDGNPSTLPPSRLIIEANQRRMRFDGRKQHIQDSAAIECPSQLLRPAHQHQGLGVERHGLGSRPFHCIRRCTEWQGHGCGTTSRLS
jgi:hypothetical protein